MRRAHLSIITVLASAILAQPALAKATAQDARAFLADYGQCIVKREPAIARAYVLSGDFYNPNNADHRRLTQRECLPAQQGPRALRMSNDVLRGAIAEVLFQRDAASLAVTEFAAVPALHYQDPWPVQTTSRDGEPLAPNRIEAQQKAFAFKQGEVARARLGECVVRAAPAASRAVLVTTIDTPAELQALQGVTSALSDCLPAGQTIGFDRMTLRGTLAVAYYRLSVAAQSTGANQ